MTTLLGQKVGMTRIVDKHGRIVAATVIEAKPNSVTLHRTTKRDGYSAMQLGYGEPKNVNKPQLKQLEKAKATAGKTMIEVRTMDSDELPALGSELTATTFKPGDVINVVATSRGRGFAGTVKRHNFKIGPRSHGSMNQRRPGSIGAQQPQRVIPGKRMAGRLGGDRTTVKHLEILDVLPAEHLIVIAGAVPGIKGALVQMSLSPRHARTEASTEAPLRQQATQGQASTE